MKSAAGWLKKVVTFPKPSENQPLRINFRTIQFSLRHEPARKVALLYEIIGSQCSSSALDKKNSTTSQAKTKSSSKIMSNVWFRKKNLFTLFNLNKA